MSSELLDNWLQRDGALVLGRAFPFSRRFIFTVSRIMLLYCVTVAISIRPIFEAYLPDSNWKASSLCRCSSITLKMQRTLMRAKQFGHIFPIIKSEEHQMVTTASHYFKTSSTNVQMICNNNDNPLWQKLDKLEWQYMKCQTSQVRAV